MVKHYNTTLIQQQQAIFKTKGTDSLPPLVDEKITPIVNIGPYISTVNWGSAVNATSGTITTTPTTRDYYISIITMGVVKDVTATSTSTIVKAYIEGLLRSIAIIPTLTLTAERADVTICLPTPLKIDPNTAILITNTTNVGNISASATLFSIIV